MQGTKKRRIDLWIETNGTKKRLFTNHFVVNNGISRNQLIRLIFSICIFHAEKPGGKFYLVVYDMKNDLEPIKSFVVKMPFNVHENNETRKEVLFGPVWTIAFDRCGYDFNHYSDHENAQTILNVIMAQDANFLQDEGKRLIFQLCRDSVRGVLN